MSSALTVRAPAVAAILMWLAVSVPTPVGACVCGTSSDASLCVKTSAYDAVFVAEVIEKTLVNHGPQVLETFRYETRNRMRVSEDFFGTVGAEVDVYTGANSSCAFSFAPGVPYVVYASRGTDGQLRTGICSPTHRLASDKGDLEYLRAAAKAAPSHGTIEGKAVIARLNVPLAGVRVVARAGNRRYETTAARDGSYTLAVPPGAYRVRYAVDPALYSREVRVHVPRGGSCIVPAISVFPNGRVSGRVVDSSGTPVSDVPVLLTPLTPQDGTSNTATTDAHGNYSIVRVFPGRFRLTALGVVESPRTTGIRVALGERKKLPELVLSDSIRLFTVSGTVRLAFGGVAAGTTVVLMELKDPVPGNDNMVRIVRAVTTDGTGRFVLRGLPGRYRLNAYLTNDIRVATLTEPFDGRGNVSMDLTLRQTRSY